MVYPNPATNNTTISFISTKGNKYTIEITDLKGKILERIKGISSSAQTNLILDVSKYTKGVYLINLIDENGKRSIKMNRQ